MKDDVTHHETSHLWRVDAAHAASARRAAVSRATTSADRAATTPPLIREGATVKLTVTSGRFPTSTSASCPTSASSSAARPRWSSIPGLGPRNGEAIVREMKKVSNNTEVYVVDDALPS